MPRFRYRSQSLGHQPLQYYRYNLLHFRALYLSIAFLYCPTLAVWAAALIKKWRLSMPVAFAGIVGLMTTDLLARLISPQCVHGRVVRDYSAVKPFTQRFNLPRPECELDGQVAISPLYVGSPS
jgi:hypothetical protein